MKKVILLVLSAIAFLQAESFTFYLLVPEYREWLEMPPIIKNLANGDVIPMERDAEEYYGWYHYTWEKDSIPDSVLIYSSRDTSFEDPIASDGFCSKTNDSFPLKMMSDLVDTVYFVSELSWRIVDGVDEYGFAYNDIRQDIYYSKDDSFEYYSKKMYVLVPDYKEWIDEIPILVDAKDSLKYWEMKPDEQNKGWFSYSWNHCSISPDSLYLYKKTDSTRLAPVGESGFAYGETDLVPLKFENTLNIFFYPDLRYDCAIPDVECFCNNAYEKCYCNAYEKVRWKSYDVRPACQLRYDCLKDDFEPYYYNMELRPVRMAAQIHVQSIGSAIQMSSSKLQPFAVFNAMGQVMTRGTVNGITNVKVPNSGMYLVKIGSEVHRLNVR